MNEPRDALLCCLAVLNGRDEEAAKILARRPELATGDVHVAAARADVGALGTLLERDAELANAPLPLSGPGPGFPPLMVLCHAVGTAARGVPLEEAAKLLLARGADPNAVVQRSVVDRDDWYSALGGAAGVLGKVELCQILLEAGAEPNDGIALFRAVDADGWACFDRILTAGGDTNDTRNRRGTTPLHHVLDTSYTLDRVQELLARGADPNLSGKDPSGIDETPLHVAVRRRRIEPLAILLDHGAEIDAETSGGMTAWRHALRRGFDDVAEWLAKRGADVARTAGDELAVQLLLDDRDGARKTLAANTKLARDLVPEEARLLPDLAARDLAEAVAMLLDAGWDPLARGLDGGTALHQTAWFAAPRTAELLIERGAPLDPVCHVHDGSPLAWCAHGSQFSGGAEGNAAYARIAELLCEAGAVLSWTGVATDDPGGRRLLAVAAPEVAAVLRRHGAG